MDLQAVMCVCVKKRKMHSIRICTISSQMHLLQVLKFRDERDEDENVDVLYKCKKMSMRSHPLEILLYLHFVINTPYLNGAAI